MIIDSFRKEYVFLSNFAPVILKYQGIGYPSYESIQGNLEVNRAIVNINKALQGVVISNNINTTEIGVINKILSNFQSQGFDLIEEKISDIGFQGGSLFNIKRY